MKLALVNSSIPFLPKIPDYRKYLALPQNPSLIMKAETSKFNKVEIVHVLRADPNLSKNPKKLKDYLLQNNTKNDGSKMPKYSIKSQP